MDIEIWSDVVCPWCYIGKRRFEGALRRFAHADALEVTWRSFQLDPEAPRSYGGDSHDFLADKLGGDVDRARAMNAHVTRLAAEVGLHYDMDRTRPGNTFDAHRLLHVAARHGVRAEAKERLLHGYFTEGLDVSDHAALAAAVADVGVPEREARAALAGDDHAEDVRADGERARTLGIGGVPFFVLGGRYGISGAQPEATFLEGLGAAWRAVHEEEAPASG